MRSENCRFMCPKDNTNVCSNELYISRSGIKWRYFFLGDVTWGLASCEYSVERVENISIIKFRKLGNFSLNTRKKLLIHIRMRN